MREPPKPVETDFAAALKMLALLPLSDEERADAVRRLLAAVSTNLDGTN